MLDKMVLVSKEHGEIVCSTLPQASNIEIPSLFANDAEDVRSIHAAGIRVAGLSRIKK
jgi:hypothetical protein